MKQAKLMAFVLAIPIVQLAQFPFPIPRIPSIPIRIPSLENLLKEEPPITSNIKDARSEVPFLDDFNPQQGVLMTLLSRSSQGGFRVQPGLFELNAQSYCLHAGSYRPGQGDGYVYAPLQGSRASIIRHILQKSVDRPEIPQQDIQVLLWAIIARTKIGDMSESSQQVARMLLTKEEISQLNGGALGLIPDILKQQLLANLPESVRQVLEVENHLRQVLTQANASFEQLERIAVLVGNPAPDKNSREVPSGRWSYHPDGYFVRYQPSGYSQTQIQLYVPERFQIQRDDRDRITSIADARGERIEIAYDDTIAPVAIPGEANVRGYAFRSIRFTHHLVVPPEIAVTLNAEWNNRGWTLVGVPTEAGRSNSPSQRFPDLQERYAWSRQHKQQVDRLVEEMGKTSRSANSGGNIAEVVNLGHLAVALKNAIAADFPNSQSWQLDQIDLVKKAWQSAVCEQFGSCTQSKIALGMKPAIEALADSRTKSGVADSPIAEQDNPSEYDPSENVAMPGNTARQRLAQSARSSDRGDCKLVSHDLKQTQEIRDVYADPELLEAARNNNWTGQDYDDAVQKKLAEKWAKQSGRNVSVDDEVFNPMYVSPETCNLQVNWDKNEYKKRGLAEVSYDADYIHEKVHEQHCKQARNPRKYNDDMSFPQKRSQEELSAYDAKLKFLQNWMQKNCH